MPAFSQGGQVPISPRYPFLPGHIRVAFTFELGMFRSYFCPMFLYLDNEAKSEWAPNKAVHVVRHDSHVWQALDHNRSVASRVAWSLVIFGQTVSMRVVTTNTAPSVNK